MGDRPRRSPRPGQRRCKQGEFRTGRSVFQPTAMRWPMLVRQWSQSTGPADYASISLPRPWQPFAGNCIGPSDRGNPCLAALFPLLRKIKAVMPRFPKPEASPSANAHAGSRGSWPGEIRAVDHHFAHYARVANLRPIDSSTFTCNRNVKVEFERLAPECTSQFRSLLIRCKIEDGELRLGGLSWLSLPHPMQVVFRVMSRLLMY